MADVLQCRVHGRSIKNPEFFIFQKNNDCKNHPYIYFSFKPSTMLKNLFFIAILFTGLIACKSKSAYNYSEAIVAKDRSLTPHIEETEGKVGRYIAANQYDSVAIAGEAMEKLIQQKIDEINALPVPKAKEADNFKTATIRYFNFIKSLYTGYKNLGKAQTEEERQQVLTDLQKLVSEKPAVIADMQKAQGKYADANGFKVK